MSKERIKSLILVCLVVVNFVLGARILSDKKLWPYGYNFFVSFGNSGIFRAITGGQDIKTAKMKLTMPREIIVNTGEQTSRVALTSESEKFLKICETVSDILREVLDANEKKIVLAQKSDWVSALNARSICLNYHVPHDTRIFAQFLDADGEGLYSVIPTVDRIIVSADGTVYFENPETGEFYSVHGKKNIAKISAVISEVRATGADNKSVINYSVDLKFDEALGGQKAILSSAVPVYSSAVKLPYLCVENPVSDGNGMLKKATVDKILSLFKINTNTVRRYTEVDGTIVFVENNGILKINPVGVISYNSTGSEGFIIASGREYSETVAAVADFADRINSACMIENGLFASTPVTPHKDTLTFDYTAWGIPVMYKRGDIKNAVTVEVGDGSIVSYRHVLANYTPSTADYELTQYIDALDKAIEYYSKDMSSIEINKMYTAYTDDGGVEPEKADWKIEVKSIEIKEGE